MIANKVLSKKSCAKLILLMKTHKELINCINYDNFEIMHCEEFWIDDELMQLFSKMHFSHFKNYKNIRRTNIYCGYIKLFQREW